MVILQVKKLSKHFGGITALDNLDLEVYKGEIVSVIGPNGAGKTTLFNCLTGIITPDSGTVYFQTKTNEIINIIGFPPNKISFLGMSRTFQNVRLFQNMTVLENVFVSRFIHSKASFIKSLFSTKARKENEDKVLNESYKLLEFVGLKDKAIFLAKNLAYGEQRKLELARALATDPILLLLDEPTCGMNPFETAELMNLILHLKELGITILLIEHDMRVVLNISTRVVVLDYGEKIFEGPPQIVRHDPKVVEAYLGTVH